MMRTTATFLCAMALSVSSAAQEPSLKHVLSRAADYVAGFYKQLSGIVAEETYQQMGRSYGAFSPVDTRRTLQSDLLLVRPTAADRYVEFRDVFAVDGRPVRDRAERLTTLFLSPSAANRDLMRTIIEESARQNIGDIPRNINTPMLTLHFLQAETQRRFRFTRAKPGAPELARSSSLASNNAPTFRVSTEIWVIEFRETDRPTVIKTYRGQNFPASGRFWIDPATGVVRMSELVMENRDVTANIIVSYQSEPLLGFFVPVEMRERYRTRVARVEGAATYGKFRRFQVKTDEVIAKPPGR